MIKASKYLEMPQGISRNLKSLFPGFNWNISSFCLEFTYWIKKVCLSQRFEPRSSGHEGNTESTELPGYLSSKFHILYTSETLVIMVYVFTKYLQTLKRTDKCILQHASNNVFGKFSFLLKKTISEKIYKNKLRLQQYQVGTTSSRKNTEAKQLGPRIALG